MCNKILLTEEQLTGYINMKKAILCCVAVMFSAQVAFANDLDDVDDVQEAIGSVIGSAISNAIGNSTGSAIAGNEDNGVDDESQNQNGGGNGGGNGSGVTGQFVALNAAQLNRIGDQLEEIGMKSACKNNGGNKAAAQKPCRKGITGIYSADGGGVSAAAVASNVAVGNNAGDFLVDE